MSQQVPRVEQWSRGNALPVSIAASSMLNAAGAVTSASAVVARLYAAGTAEPPVAMSGRSDVSLSLSSGVWRGSVDYGTDLDALTTVRVIVTGTFSGASARLADAQVALVRPSGR